MYIEDFRPILFAPVVILFVLTFIFRAWLGARELGKILPSYGALFRRSLLRHFLLAAAVLGLLVVLAGPYRVGRGKEVSPTSLQAVILADTSLSMTAQADKNQPMRLLREAKIAVTFVNAYSDADIGLCEFTNKIFCRAPLGSEMSSILSITEVLSPDAITGSGSEITSALNYVMLQFAQSERQSDARFIVLLSDGGDEFTSDYYWGELTKVLENLASQNVRVIAIGVGENYPVPVALEETGVQNQYKVIYSQLDEAKMRYIAEYTGGVYLHESELAGRDISAILNPALVSAGALRPIKISLAWIPEIAVIGSLFLYLFFFRRNL